MKQETIVDRSIFLAIAAIILFFESIITLFSVLKGGGRGAVILDKRANLGINTNFSLIIKERS